MNICYVHVSAPIYVKRFNHLTAEKSCYITVVLYAATQQVYWRNELDESYGT